MEAFEEDSPSTSAPKYLGPVGRDAPLSNPKASPRKGCGAQGGEYAAVTDGGNAQQQREPKEIPHPGEVSYGTPGEKQKGIKREKAHTSAKENRARRKKRKLRKKILWTDVEGRMVKKQHTEQDSVNRAWRDQQRDIPANHKRSEEKKKERNRKRTMRIRINRKLSKKVNAQLRAAGIPRSKPLEPSLVQNSRHLDCVGRRPKDRIVTNDKSKKAQVTKVDTNSAMRAKGLLQKAKRIKMHPDARRELIRKKREEHEAKVLEKKKLSYKQQTLKPGKNKGKRSWISKIRDLIRIMVFNPTGVTGLHKRRDIEDYAEQRSIMIAALTETQHSHTAEEGGSQRTTPEGELVGGKYKWYHGSGIDPKIHEELQQIRKNGKKGSKARKKELIEKAREHGGTAVMLHKNIWNHLERIETVGSRLMKCRLKFKKKLDVIIVYGQQANKSLQEKERLYEDLQKMVDDTPPRNMLLIRETSTPKCAWLLKKWRKKSSESTPSEVKQTSTEWQTKQKSTDRNS